jgi:hypothetical protein
VSVWSRKRLLLVHAGLLPVWGVNVRDGANTAAERIYVAHSGTGSMLKKVQFGQFNAPTQQSAVIVSKLLQVD